MHCDDLDSRLAEALIQRVRKALPEALSLYAFGSRVQGTAGQQSDLDLAVLVAGYADPVRLWQLAGELADVAGCEVDLLDMRAASTVMQSQILNTGQRLWASDHRAGIFEGFVLSEKTGLDEARSGLMADIQKEGRVYADDVLINKAATIERCVSRAHDEYRRDPESFGTDFTRQDAAILNVQRACEAALDMGQYLIRRERLGVPQSARDVFALLAQANWIDASLADSLKRMVGFRNIAVHDYQSLQLPIVVNVITRHLDDFLRYSEAILKRGG